VLLVEGATELPLIPELIEANGVPGQRAPILCADRHLDTSPLHTWLAWQKPPGLQLHDAVKQRLLDPTADASKPFVTWFCDLFEVSLRRDPVRVRA